jgi:hypothetical protein
MVGDPILVHLMNAKQVDLWRMDPSDIELREICLCLARTCRYRGVLPVFYSVARHSLNLADMVSEPLRQAALLHDMAEAYVGDLVGPIKHQLCPEFIKLEQVVSEVVVSALATNAAVTSDFLCLDTAHHKLTIAELALLDHPHYIEQCPVAFGPSTIDQDAQYMFSVCCKSGIRERGA